MRSVVPMPANVFLSFQHICRNLMENDVHAVHRFVLIKIFCQRSRGTFNAWQMHAPKKKLLFSNLSWMCVCCLWNLSFYLFVCNSWPSALFGNRKCIYMRVRAWWKWLLLRWTTGGRWYRPLLVFAVISIITECSKQINCITDSQWRTVPSVLINVLRCQNIILFTADECFVILTQTHRVCAWCIVIVMVIDFSAAL